MSKSVTSLQSSSLHHCAGQHSLFRRNVSAVVSCRQHYSMSNLTGSRFELHTSRSRDKRVSGVNNRITTVVGFNLLILNYILKFKKNLDKVLIFLIFQQTVRKVYIVIEELGFRKLNIQYVFLFEKLLVYNSDSLYWILTTTLSQNTIRQWFPTFSNRGPFWFWKFFMAPLSKYCSRTWPKFSGQISFELDWDGFSGWKQVISKKKKRSSPKFKRFFQPKSGDLQKITKKVFTKIQAQLFQNTAFSKILCGQPVGLGSQVERHCNKEYAVR